MNENPYAQPQSPGTAFGPGAYGGHGPVGAPGGPPQNGPSQPWDIGEVLSKAWELFQAQWLVCIFAPVLAHVAGMVPSWFAGSLVGMKLVAADSSLAWGLRIGGMGVAFILHAFFQVGLMRIFLGVARGQSPDFGVLFSGADRFLPMLATMILSGLVCGLGLLCFVVPGVIAALGVTLANYYCVDAGLGPVEAIKASWDATRGHKGALFGYAIVAVLLVFAGMLACCIGVFVPVALIGLGYAIIFLRISGRGGPPTDDVMGPMVGGFGPPPQGGYGAPPGGGYGAPTG